MNRKKWGAIIVSVGMAVCQGVVPITSLAVPTSAPTAAADIKFTVVKSEAAPGDLVPIAVNANIANTTVTEMTIYANQTIVATVNSGSWKGTYVVPENSGDINFFAIVKTSDGQTIRSNITVTKVVSQLVTAPTINLVVTSTTAKAGQTVPVAVSTQAGTSGVTKVAVYAGNELVGTAEGSAYRGSWKAAGNGKVELKAVVTTADGKQYTSAIKTVEVEGEAEVVAPTINLVVTSTTAKAGQTVPVAVSTQAGTSGVTKVAVYAGNELVGTAEGSAYRGSWKAAGNGKVELKAVVTTADGKQYTSAIKTVNVENEVVPPTGISSLKVVANNQVREETTSTLSQRFILTNDDATPVDLSKVEIRYYFTSDGNQSQNFFCDYAGMNMNKDPWFINMTNDITGTITNDYYSIKINSGTLDNGSKMEIATRVSKVDWTSYSQSNDYSYTNGIVVLYDGKVVSGVIPNN